MLIEALGPFRHTAAAVAVHPQSVDSVQNELSAFFTIESPEKRQRLPHGEPISCACSMLCWLQLPRHNADGNRLSTGPANRAAVSRDPDVPNRASMAA